MKKYALYIFLYVKIMVYPVHMRMRSTNIFTEILLMFIEFSNKKFWR